MVFFGVSHLELNLDVDYSTRRLFVVHFWNVNGLNYFSCCMARII
jgi:hypothetical protein